MGTILVALGVLLLTLGLIVAGTRFSLYLYLLNFERARHFTQRMPVTQQRMSQDSEYSVERPMYYQVLDTNDSSARYARNSLMVIAFILLLAIMATISVLAGLFH